MPPETAFFLGTITGALATIILGFVWRLWSSNRAYRKAGATPQNAEFKELRSQTAALLEENGTLKALIERNDARVAVLEEIAIDPANRTARAIDALR